MFCEPRPRVLEGSECNPFKEPAIHNNDSTRKAMEAAKQPQEVRPKPALPPKPSATVVAPPLPAPSSAALAAADLSEKDRDSEPPPEGSVDQSPTYSESVQSGTAGGAGTASTGTPAYVRWAESVQYLLDDTDGFQLFKQYLVQQCLDHLLMFYVTCKGFKNTVQENNDKEVDPESRAQLKGDELKLAGVINKRYINPSRKNLATKIEFIDDEARKVIEKKIAAAKAAVDLKATFDTNIFDGVQQEVLEHLEAKCYPNFLKSEVYIDHVQACQAAVLMSTLSAAESSSASRGQNSGAQSSASSVSMRVTSSVSTARQDDSGISGISDPKSSADPAPAATAAATKSLPNVDNQSPVSVISSSQLFPTGQQAAAQAAVAANSSAMLPTVDEDKELKIMLSDSNSSLTSRGVSGKSQVPYSAAAAKPEQFVNPSAGIRPKLNPARFNPAEMHPSSGPGPAPPITSASYAYHAYSSNWNPVSRQDSEIQSQSSGAIGGDTTDDNYSSFTDGGGNQQIHHLPSSYQHHSRSRHPQQSKWEKRREQKLEKKKIEESSQKNKDVTSQIIPRPRTHQAVPPGQAPQNPEEFARILTAKLQAVIDSNKNAQEERAKQKRLAEKLNQIDADSSVASFPASAAAKNIILNRSSARGDNANDPESDQSILDDHFNRVFVDTPPVSRSPPSTANPAKMKAMSQSFDNMRISHHTRTLPGRSSRGHGGNISNNSSLIQHNFGPMSGYRSANTSGFGAAGGNFAGDLAYFPHGSGGQKRGPGATSYSDVDFGGMAGAPAGGGGGNGQFQQSRQPMAYNTQTKERVSDWVQNVSSSFASSHHYPAATADQLSESKGSGRHRAKSQDRGGPAMRTHHYPPIQPGASAGGGNNNSFNMYQGPVQPNLLEARLLQHQASRLNNNVSMMAPPPPPPGAPAKMNMSLPTAAASAATTAMDYHQPEATEFTTAVYKFPQEKEDMPYRVKIPGKYVTLRHVKEFMPKKGAFRYYFKTEIDGEVCFEEETDDRAQVPMFQAKIIVQCRND